MKINCTSSPLPTSSNNIIPSSTSFNTEQLDQLSNQLRMLNIDDESINKVLEQLKTIKNEIFDNEDIVEQTDLLDFVLFKFRPIKYLKKMDIKKLQNNITKYQEIISTYQKLLKTPNISNDYFVFLTNEIMQTRTLLAEAQALLVNYNIVNAGFHVGPHNVNNFLIFILLVYFFLL